MGGIRPSRIIVVVGIIALVFPAIQLTAAATHQPLTSEAGWTSIRFTNDGQPVRIVIDTTGPVAPYADGMIFYDTEGTALDHFYHGLITISPELVVVSEEGFPHAVNVSTRESRPDGLRMITDGTFGGIEGEFVLVVYAANDARSRSWTLDAPGLVELGRESGRGIGMATPPDFTQGDRVHVSAAFARAWHYDASLQVSAENGLVAVMGTGSSPLSGRDRVTTSPEWLSMTLPNGSRFECDRPLCGFGHLMGPRALGAGGFTFHFESTGATHRGGEPYVLWLDPRLPAREPRASGLP